MNIKYLFEVHFLEHCLALEQSIHRHSLARIREDVEHNFHFTQLLRVVFAETANEFGEWFNEATQLTNFIQVEVVLGARYRATSVPYHSCSSHSSSLRCVKHARCGYLNVHHGR